MGPTKWALVAQVLPRAIPNLKHLEVATVKGISRKDLAVLVGGFPRLQRLSVRGLAFPPKVVYDRRGEAVYRIPKDEFTYGYPALHHLVYLRLSKEWVMPIRLFDTLKLMQALETLTIALGPEVDFSMIGHFADEPPVEAVIYFLRTLPIEVLSRRARPFAVNLEMAIPSRVAGWFQMAVSLNCELPATWTESVTGVILVARRPVLPWTTAHAPVDALCPDAERWFKVIFPNVRAVVIKSEGGDALVDASLRDLSRSEGMRESLSRMDVLEIAGEVWTNRVDGSA